MSTINRRDLLRRGAVVSTGIAASGILTAQCTKKNTPVKRKKTIKAGFARVNITPPVGTGMTGFGTRDFDPEGCRGIHDDLFSRALYLKQSDSEMLIMGFDLLFFSRDEADRYKGAIGRATGLSPNQILLNTSHTHTGPKVGTWLYTPPDYLYLNQLEKYIVETAEKAVKNARETTIWAGTTLSDIPMSRRLPDETGHILFAPNPDGAVYNKLPLCFIKDMNDEPVCLMFSVSCHPSTIKGDFRTYYVSADYPGAAMSKIDAHLGTTCSLFLQGVAGDTKASVIGKGLNKWKSGTWEDVDRAGTMAADAVIAEINKGLTRIEPALATQTINMEWLLEPPLDRAGYEKIYKTPVTHEESVAEIMRPWAQEMMERIDRGFTLDKSVPISAHGVKLGEGLRIFSLEGEAVAEYGGITLPLGYSDGCQMYLPTTEMLPEGGYEVESYWEYRMPAPLAGGMEKILETTLNQMRSMGIT